jgi:RecA/RadA recombinase
MNGLLFLSNNRPGWKDRRSRPPLGDDAIRQAETIANLPVEVILTGNPTLDEALEVGGLPHNRIVDICGQENCGPSLICFFSG